MQLDPKFHLATKNKYMIRLFYISYIFHLTNCFLIPKYYLYYNRLLMLVLAIYIIL